MITYTLIVFFYVGMWGDTDSVAVTTVPGFTTQATCEAAAAKVQPAVNGTKKEIRTACVRVQ